MTVAVKPDLRVGVSGGRMWHLRARWSNGPIGVGYYETFCGKRGDTSWRPNMGRRVQERVCAKCTAEAERMDVDHAHA